MTNRGRVLSDIGVGTAPGSHQYAQITGRVMGDNDLYELS
jgi:hypothetical protein